MPIDTKTLKYLLNRVEKPGRYTGKEVGSASNDIGSKLRFVLAFPDIYEIGMSNAGIRLLYYAVNNDKRFSCERVFSPWKDLENLLRDGGIPLFTLESHSFLIESDAIGISMQTELSVTNAINILDLGQIPLRRDERDNKDYPVIFAGGQGIINPEPYADFFDFFFLGEGDHKIIDILEAIQRFKEEHKDRKRLMYFLSLIDGVYVPGNFEPVYDRGKFCRIEAADPKSPFPKAYNEPIIPQNIRINKNLNYILPNIKPVHNRAVIEIARGCISGCRFCQSGYYCRPYRPKPGNVVLSELKELLLYRFYESITLLSLNIEDYPNIDCLLKNIICQTKNHYINISLPSIRASMLSEEIAKSISTVRKAGFTIAPEAGSQRLRNIINKNLTEQEILEASKFAYMNGWDLIKCYFMIGLPFETNADVDSILSLANDISRAGRIVRGRSGRLNIGLSPFVPKAWTPFQWAPFQDESELSEKIRYIKKNIRNKRIIIKENSPFMAFVEAVLSTGDRRLNGVIFEVFRRGERFSNWGDSFDYNKWKEALRSCNYPYDSIYSERSTRSPLPYDHINAGISKSFLRVEYNKSKECLTTERCSPYKCNACGVAGEGETNKCFQRVKEEDNTSGSEKFSLSLPKSENTGNFKLRLVYEKRGLACYLGNIDTLEAIKRIFKIAGFPVEYSRGFNPGQVYDVLPPLPLGMEGYNELFDIHLSYKIIFSLSYLNSLLPSGIIIKNAYWVDEYDMLLKRCNIYYLGIKTRSFNYSQFCDIIRKFSESEPIHIDKFFNNDSYYSFRVRFKSDHPLSLRRFYDYISGFTDEDSSVFRLFCHKA